MNERHGIHAVRYFHVSNLTWDSPIKIRKLNLLFRESPDPRANKREVTGAKFS